MSLDPAYPSIDDPLVREAIKEARIAMRTVRDRIEEAVEAADRAMTLIDGLDDLAAAVRPLRAVR